MSYNSIVAMTPDAYVYRYNQKLRQKQEQEERELEVAILRGQLASIQHMANLYELKTRKFLEYYDILAQEAELNRQLAEEKLKKFREDNNGSNQT